MRQAADSGVIGVRAMAQAIPIARYLKEDMAFHVAGGVCTRNQLWSKTAPLPLLSPSRHPRRSGLWRAPQENPSASLRGRARPGSRIFKLLFFMFWSNRFEAPRRLLLWHNGISQPWAVRRSGLCTMARQSVRSATFCSFFPFSAALRCLAAWTLRTGRPQLP